MHKVLKFILFLSFLGTATGIGTLFFLVHNHIVDFSPLEAFATGTPSVLLDCNGVEWGRFELDRREPIQVCDMPQHLIDAFLAAEDHCFYDHHGISWKGIIRSLAVNLWQRRRAQGASTITQQLVRLLYFDTQRTFSRKIKEQITALLVERQFTKEQILQTYLNHIYLGCGIYGVEAAAQRFWAKSASEVSIDEAAILAAIINCPGLYCPLISTEHVVKRRDLVLTRMARHGFITPVQAEESYEKLIEMRESTKTIAPHARETIRVLLENKLGRERLYSGGLKIQTTLNVRIQNRAQVHFTREFAKLRERYREDADGALLSMDPQSGEIRAMIGGYDFGTSKFNRALQARRQMGSIFKPLVYAVGVEQGKKMSDTLVDEPVEFQAGSGTWSPKNWNKKHVGRVTLAHALSISNNIITIKTMLEAGTERVVDLAKRCRIKGEILPYPSLALGCLDVTVLEALGAFNVFANNGVYVQPHLIKWVKDQWGNKLYRSEAVRERVLPARVAGQVSKALMISLNNYLRRAHVADFPAEGISKTGTTNDSRTMWFCGATPELSTTIYLGTDDNSSQGTSVYPQSTIFPIWAALYKDIPHANKAFRFDPSLKEVSVDSVTGEYRDSPSARGVVRLFE